ncbi:MAG: hypothetical protein GXO97_05440 [Nitrospirae bacterium]|nr:hypothetical protein [Nitrospirota bacterium]
MPKKEIKRPSIVTPELLLQRATLKGISSLKASLQVKVYNDGDYLGVYPGSLIYKQPDLLKLSLYAPFGITVMEFLYKKGEIQIYIPAKDTLYRGDVSFRRLLPDEKKLLSLPHQLKNTKSGYLLSFYNTDEKIYPKAIYIFSENTIQWKGLELYRGDKKVLKIGINELQENLPTDFEVVTGRFRVRLFLKDIVINPELKDSLFHTGKASWVLPLRSFGGWHKEWP